MYNSRFKLLFILFSCISMFSYGQEICNNAIDDDGDGLIDLNDSECICENAAELFFIDDSKCSQVKLIAADPSLDALSFQWYKDGIALSDEIYVGNANLNVLRLNPIISSESVEGIYQCHFEVNGNCMQSMSYTYVYPGKDILIDSVYLCQGESFELELPDGSTTSISSPGSFTANGVGENGCPYEHTTYVLFNSSSSTDVDIEICQGSSYSLGGQEIFESGVYQTALTNVSGCDSIVTVNLVVQSSLFSLIEIQELDTVCINQSDEYAIPAKLGSEEEGIFRYEGPGIMDEFSPIVNLDLISTGRQEYNIEFNSMQGCLIDSKSFELDVMSTEDGACLVNSSKDQNEYLLPMTIAPNPSNGLFQLSTLLDKSNAKLEVMDIEGRVVYSAVVVDQRSNLDLRHISLGMYLVRVSDGSSSSTLRIVITDL